MNDFFVTSAFVSTPPPFLRFECSWFMCVCFFLSLSLSLPTIIHFQIDLNRIEYRTRCQWKRNSIKHLIQRKFLSNILINSAFVTSQSLNFAQCAASVAIECWAPSISIRMGAPSLFHCCHPALCASVHALRLTELCFFLCSSLALSLSVCLSFTHLFYLFPSMAFVQKVYLRYFHHFHIYSVDCDIFWFIRSFAALIVVDWIGNWFICFNACTLSMHAAINICFECMCVCACMFVRRLCSRMKNIRYAQCLIQSAVSSITSMTHKMLGMVQCLFLQYLSLWFECAVARGLTFKLSCEFVRFTSTCPIEIETELSALFRKWFPNTHNDFSFLKRDPRRSI